METAASEPQRGDAHHLERCGLPQRRDGDGGGRPRAVGSGPCQGKHPVEAAAQRWQQADAQAEHVVAVAGHRRPDGMGPDGYRRAQGIRLQRKGTVGARHPEGLRRIRTQLGLCVLAAPAPGCALRAGPARHEHRRPVVRDQGRWCQRQDVMASRASDERDHRVARLVYDADGPSVRRRAPRS